MNRLDQEWSPGLLGMHDDIAMFSKNEENTHLESLEIDDYHAGG